jgi:DNA modification methylase
VIQPIGKPEMREAVSAGPRLASRLKEKIMNALTIQYQAVSSLQLRARNPRTHPKTQIRQIANSIEQFGFVNPVLVDVDNCIIVGHGRVEAAKLIGITDVPTVRIEHMSETQIRAYVIADNKLALNAGWAPEILKLELEELSSNLGFEVTLTGFVTAEIDQILLGADEEGDEADIVPETNHIGPAVSRMGDLWRIGNHFVLCGDATRPESYARLLGGKRAEFVFTDPPYNVRINGHVSGLGKTRHEEFAMASGEMDRVQFTNFLGTVFRNLADHSTGGSIHYICMDWRHMRELLGAAEGPYAELKNLCVWNKTNGGMGSFYRSQHELVFVFQNGSGPHINNVELGRHGRYRTNVWTYPGVNTFGQNRDAELAMHPTVKPVALVADAIKDASKRNAIVLDAFGGSGTTLVAAERTGRLGYALEISPHYVDTIVKRVSEAVGREAVLEATGETFDEVRLWRASGLDKEDAQMG